MSDQNGASARRPAVTSHDRNRRQIRRLTQGAVLTALALVLSIVERWIPLDLIVPIPGIKLGLANIVTLFALLRLSPLDAAIILLIRSLVMGLITGPTTLMFSLAGGTLALLVMWLLSRFEGRAFSLVGISVAGAAAHNIGQISVGVLLLSEPLLYLMYLPPLLLAGLVTGTLTGITAFPIAARFSRREKMPDNRLRG
jgi:heptaprenyl diphosphate synthase